MSATKTGKKFTPEHRAKISAALKGKIRSPEHSTNISLAKKKLNNSDATRRGWETRRRNLGGT
jgi:hypothetical protein